MAKQIKFTEAQKKEICRLYDEELNNSKEIGVIFSCSGHTIFNVLRSNNVNLDGLSRKKKLYKAGKIVVYNKKVFSKNEILKIINIYEKELKGYETIGKIFECGPNPIKRILIENNIKLRKHEIEFTKEMEIEICNLYEKELKSCNEIGKIFGCCAPKISKIIKKNNKYENRSIRRTRLFRQGKIKHVSSNKINFSQRQIDIIINLYTNKLMSSLDIGKKFGCTMMPIIRVLKDNNVKVTRPWNKNKTSLEDFRILDGEKNGQWLGGKSFEPYGLEFNKQFKKTIRERDGCCMLCNIEIEDLHLLKRRIHVHHTNYDKLCNLKQNCITLCNSCHMKTNVNRTQWTTFFQSILSERYGYKYEDNKIVVEIT